MAQGLPWKRGKFQRLVAIFHEATKMEELTEGSDMPVNLPVDRAEEMLRVRSGAIQAALNLDFAGTGDYNGLGIFFGKRE